MGRAWFPGSRLRHERKGWPGGGREGLIDYRYEDAGAETVAINGFWRHTRQGWLGGVCPEEPLSNEFLIVARESILRRGINGIGILGVMVMGIDA